jgi:hypothetical protein
MNYQINLKLTLAISNFKAGNSSMLSYQLEAEHPWEMISKDCGQPDSPVSA